MSRRFAVPPANAASVFALGGAVLWGVIEFMALCRSRWSARRRGPSSPTP